MADTTRTAVERFLSLPAKGDADAVADVFAEDIDWFVPGADHLPWTGARTSRADVPACFRAMWPVFVAGESETVVESVLVDGPDAALFGRFSHTVRATGRRFTTPVAFRFTVHDGLITRMHLFEDTLAVARAIPAAS